MIISENVEARFFGDDEEGDGTTPSGAKALPALGRRAVGEAAATPPAVASSSAAAFALAASTSHGMRRECRGVSRSGFAPVSSRVRRLERDAVVGASSLDMRPSLVSAKASKGD